MNRKQFIKGLAGAGIALGAWSALGVVPGRSTEVVQVQLPPVRKHVRHGLLSPVHANSDLGAGVSLFQEDVFFGNGYDQGPGDWRQFTFGNASGSSGLLLKDGEIWLSNASDLRPLPSSEPSRVRLANGLQLELFPVQGAFSLPENGSGVRLCWMLSGEGKLASHGLTEGYAALASCPGPVRGMANGNCLLGVLSPATLG